MHAKKLDSTKNRWKITADFRVSARLVSSLCTNEFIKMSSWCLAIRVPQKVANNWVCHWRGNATRFLCCSTCESGYYLYFTCERSYVNIYKVSGVALVAATSVSHMKVLLSFKGRLRISRNNLKSEENLDLKSVVALAALPTLHVAAIRRTEEVTLIWKYWKTQFFGRLMRTIKFLIDKIFFSNQAPNWRNDCKKNYGQNLWLISAHLDYTSYIFSGFNFLISTLKMMCKQSFLEHKFSKICFDSCFYDFAGKSKMWRWNISVVTWRHGTV